MHIYLLYVFIPYLGLGLRLLVFKKNCELGLVEQA